MKRTQKIKQQLEALLHDENERASNPELYSELLDASNASDQLTKEAIRDFSYLEDDSDSGYSLIFLTADVDATQSFLKLLRSNVSVNIKQVIRDGESWDIACFNSAILIRERFIYSFGAGSANEATVLNRTGFPDGTLQLLGGSLIRGYISTLSEDVTINHSYWLTHDAASENIEATENGETAPSPVSAITKENDENAREDSAPNPAGDQTSAAQSAPNPTQNKNNVKPKDGGAPNAITSPEGDITVDQILNW